MIDSQDPETLQTINIRLLDNNTLLSGIQFQYDSGIGQSPFFYAGDGLDFVVDIKVDEEVRKVSVQTYYGFYVTGLRLFDVDDNLINDGVWDRGLVETEGAEWSEQKIPKG